MVYAPNTWLMHSKIGGTWIC